MIQYAFTERFIKHVMTKNDEYYEHEFKSEHYDWFLNGRWYLFMNQSVQEQALGTFQGVRLFLYADTRAHARCKWVYP